MTSKDDLKKKMKQLAQESAEKADEILEAELEKLKGITSSDLNALKPKVSDQESYDVLFTAVEEATRNNEDLAALKERIKKLGPKVKNVYREVIELL